MELLLYLAGLLSMHKYLLAFLGALLIGEEAVFFLSVLAGSGSFPIWALIGFGFLGLVIADMIWFVIGKCSRVKAWRTKVLDVRGYKELRLFGNYLDKKHELLSFFVSKFVYGIRFIKLISAGARGMHWRKFIVLDSISVLLWMAIMVPLGFWAGKGFSILFKIVNGIEGVMTLLFFGVVLIVIIEFLIRRFALKVVKKKFN